MRLPSVGGPRNGAVLVYGFGPYGQFEHNVTEAVVRSLRRRGDLVTAVFNVRFNRAMFLRVLKRHTPRMIIGLGQHRTAHKLRLERKAVNQMGRRGATLKPIDPRGPDARFVNLYLAETAGTTVAYDAGTYVCNFSMYLALDYCGTRGCRFAFVHIPKDYDVAAAADYLGTAIAAARINTRRMRRT